MLNQQKYGATHGFYIMFSLNGTPVNPTLSAGDVLLVQDGSLVGNVQNLPTLVDASTPGLHYWVPTSAETQCEDVAVYIPENAAYHANVVTFLTGGNIAARLNAK